MREWLASLRRAAAPPAAVLADVAAQLRAALDRPPTCVDPLLAGGQATGLPPVPRPAPDVLGQALEVLTRPVARRARGVVHTPPALATRLVEAAVAAGGRRPRSVLDPAVGGGALLLAAARRLGTVEGLAGVDVHPLAVAVSRTVLALHAGVPAARLAERIVVADALADDVGGDLGAPFDAVVANPPFLGQLRRATARTPARRAALRARFGPAAAGYADEAGLFLLLGTRLVRPDGAVAMILPRAVLAADGSAALRAEIARRWRPELVWDDDGRTFPGARACALVLHPAGRPSGPTWAPLLSDAPDLPLRTRGTLRDLGTPRADFRDAYYTAAAHAVEGTPDDPRPWVVTSGLIDPARLRWGERPARLARRTFERPVLDRGAPAALTRPRLVPKALVATQTAVLEAVADPGGRLLPLTPVIWIPTDRPWHVAAALTGPALTALASRRHAGAALSRRALKLSARQVGALPAPADQAAFDRAAAALEAAQQAAGDQARAALLEAARHCCHAYGVDPTWLDWWVQRLPVDRTPTASGSR